MSQRYDAEPTSSKQIGRDGERGSAWHWGPGTGGAGIGAARPGNPRPGATVYNIVKWVREAEGVTSQ